MNNSKINSLKINNKTVNYEDIKNKNYFNLNFTKYELDTLDFCNKWFNEKTEFIINTSGSTGAPKPIKIKRDLMIISAKLTGDFLELKPKDKILVVLSTEYIAGLMMLVRGFVLELEIEIFEPSSNPLINLQKINYSLASFVPLQIYEIFKNTPEKIYLLNSIKNILIGGGAINSNLEKELDIVKSNIYHTYGMTETITHIALRKINGDNKSEFFKVLKDTKIKLDARNCLIINSPVTNYNDVITNDIVQIINEKEFKVIGRFDNIINTGGIKIQPEKIEYIISNILTNLNINQKFFVYGLKDIKLGEKLILIFESNTFNENLLEQIKYKMKEFLNKYEIPKEIIFVDQFNYTKNGKLDRKNTIQSLSNNK